MSSEKRNTLLFATALFLIAANFRAPLIAIAPLVGAVQEATGASPTQMGLIGTVTPLAFAIASPLAPQIAKRIGIEYTLMLGMLLAGLGSLMRGLIASPYSIIAGTFLLGVGISLSMIPLSAAIRRDQSDHIQKMASLQMFSTSVIGAIAVAIVVPLSHAIGWQWALSGWALLTLPAIVAWWKIRNDNGEKGVPEKIASDVNVYKSKLAWKIGIYIGIQSIIFFSLSIWLPKIIISKGYTAEEGGYFLSVFQLIALPTVLVVAKIAEIFQKRMENLFAAAATILFIGVVGLTWGPAGLIWLWSALAGIGCAALINLNLMLFPMRGANPGQTAALAGMTMTFGFLLSSVGPVVVGWLLQKTGGWDASFLFLNIDAFAVIILGWIAGRPGKL